MLWALCLGSCRAAPTGPDAQVVDVAEPRAARDAGAAMQALFGGGLGIRPCRTACAPDEACSFGTCRKMEPAQWPVWSGAAHLGLERRCALVESVVTQLGRDVGCGGASDFKDTATGRVVVDVHVGAARLFGESEQCPASDARSLPEVVTRALFRAPHKPKAAVSLSLEPIPGAADSFELHLGGVSFPDTLGNLLCGQREGAVRWTGTARSVEGL